MTNATPFLKGSRAEDMDVHRGHVGRGAQCVLGNLSARGSKWLQAGVKASGGCERCVVRCQGSETLGTPAHKLLCAPPHSFFSLSTTQQSLTLYLYSPPLLLLCPLSTGLRSSTCSLSFPNHIHSFTEIQYLYQSLRHKLQSLSTP